MKRRIYIQPTCTFVELKPARIICGSRGGIDDETKTISVHEDVQVDGAW